MDNDVYEEADRLNRKAFRIGVVVAAAFLLGYKFGNRRTWQKFETGWLVTSATPTTVKGGEMLRVEFRNGAHQFLQPRQ